MRRRRRIAAAAAAAASLHHKILIFVCVAVAILHMFYFPPEAPVLGPPRTLYDHLPDAPIILFR